MTISTTEPSCVVMSAPGVAAVGRRRIELHGCYAVADFVLGLASPGSFPCPENSPAYSLQFSARTGAGHYLAFGTEWGRLVIVDTRVEAKVQRDQHGPVGSHEAIVAGGSVRSRAEGGRWGIAQPSVVADYRVLSNCVFDLEWMKEDRYIALACGDGMCRLQHTETQTEVMVLTGHGGSVKAISANPINEGVLLTGSRDGSFALWDTRLPHSKPDVHGLHEAAPKPDGSLLFPVEKVYGANFSPNDSRKRPRLRAGKEKAQPSRSRNSRGDQLPHRSVTSVEWMPDGQTFLTAGQDGLIKLWDTRYALRPLQETCPAEEASTTLGRNPSPQPSFCHQSQPPFANSRKSVIGATSVWNNLKPPENGRVPKWRSQRKRGVGGSRQGVETRGGIYGGEVVAQETAERTRRPYGVSSVHVCDDGSRIAVCTVKNHISVYTYILGSLRSLGTFTGNHNSSSYYIKAKLSPDGSMLASGSTDDAVCLWRVDSPGAPIVRLTGHANEVTGVDWCRSEALKLASCSDDETVRVWTIDPQREALSKTPMALHPPTTRRSETRAMSNGLPAGLRTVEGIGDFEASVHGKFGPGMACIGGNDWWKRSAKARSDSENVTGVCLSWKNKNGWGAAVGTEGGDDQTPTKLPAAVARAPTLPIATPTAAPTTKASGNAPHPGTRAARPDDDSDSQTALANVFAQCSPNKKAGPVTPCGIPSSTVTGDLIERKFEPSDENARPDGVSSMEETPSENAITAPSKPVGLTGDQIFPFTSNFDLPDRCLLPAQSDPSSDMDLESSGSDDGVHEICSTEPGSAFPLRRLPLVESTTTPRRKPGQQQMRQGSRESLSPTFRGPLPRQSHALMFCCDHETVNVDDAQGEGEGEDNW